MVDMLLKAGANPSAVGQVCIRHENDMIMIMVQSTMEGFIKSNVSKMSCSVSLVTRLN